MRMQHPSRLDNSCHVDPVLIDDLVIKTGLIDELRIEYDKTISAYAMSRNEKLFKVPQVREFDVGRARLVLERFRNARPIWHKLIKDENPCDILFSIGEVVAHIHSEFDIPNELKVPHYLRFTSSTDEVVVLHGDLWLSNILFDESDESLVVVDWSMCPWVDMDATVGSRYIDIATLCISLFTPPKRAFFKSAYDAEIYVRCFLEGYSYNSDISLNELYKSTGPALTVLTKMYSESIKGRLSISKRCYTKVCHNCARKYFERAKRAVN